MSDIIILETIYTCLIIVSVSYLIKKFCVDKFKDKFEKAEHKAYVKSHLKYIWFELYKKYGQDIGLARCFDHFCRTNSLHCFYKDGILFWQKKYYDLWLSPVESHEIAQDILYELKSMSLYDRLEIGIPKDYQPPEIDIDLDDYV